MPKSSYVKQNLNRAKTLCVTVGLKSPTFIPKALHSKVDLM